jgi:hypothetical protein
MSNNISSLAITPRNISRVSKSISSLLKTSFITKTPKNITPTPVLRGISSNESLANDIITANLNTAKYANYIFILIGIIIGIIIISIPLYELIILVRNYRLKQSIIEKENLENNDELQTYVDSLILDPRTLEMDIPGIRLRRMQSLNDMDDTHISISP